MPVRQSDAARRHRPGRRPGHPARLDSTGRLSRPGLPHNLRREASGIHPSRGGSISAAPSRSPTRWTHAGSLPSTGVSARRRRPLRRAFSTGQVRGGAASRLHHCCDRHPLGCGARHVERRRLRAFPGRRAGAGRVGSLATRPDCGRPHPRSGIRDRDFGRQTRSMRSGGMCGDGVGQDTGGRMGAGCCVSTPSGAQARSGGMVGKDQPRGNDRTIRNRPGSCAIPFARQFDRRLGFEPGRGPIPPWPVPAPGVFVMHGSRARRFHSSPAG